MSAGSAPVRSLFVLASLLSIAAGIAAPLAAQCGPQWQPGAAVPGPGGNVWDATLLQNGDIVAVGDFTFADAAVVNRIARFDGTAWQPLGAGLDGTAYAVVAMPNGDVVAAGSFLHAGGIAVNRIARWNGSAWSPLGAGLDNLVNTLLVLPNGDVVAGGRFLSAGGVPASRIARWNGTAWSPLGAGVDNELFCLALRANGDLIAGGSFANAGGIASRVVATWNGSAWSAVPGFDHPSTVLGVAGLPNNEIAVVGTVSIGVDPYQVVIANGTTVQPLTPPAALWNDVAVLGNGDLVIGGYVSGMGSGAVARWNGTGWTSFGNGAPGRTMKFLLPANGDIVAAGMPIGSGVTASNAVARYNGTNWVSVGAPRPPKINSLVTLPGGDVVLGGEFTAIGGVAANNIARWRNGVASPLGLGVDAPVTCMSVARDGTLVVCGEFVNAGGGPALRVARWTGSTWTTVGAGLTIVPTTVAAGDGGQVIARATSLLIRYFDGATWSPLVLPFPYNPTAIAGTPEGDFVLGGIFQPPSGFTGTIRFANGVFTPTPEPYPVYKLGNDGNGHVLAMTSPGGGSIEIQRLDGNTWSSLGTYPLGSPLTLSGLPNGDPLIVTSWLGSAAAITRFDGSTWSVLESQVNVTSMDLPIASSGSGELLLGGDVRQIHGMTSNGLAVSTALCPSAASPIGPGCTGAAGPLTLAADDLPWLGGTFRSTATGFTATSLGVHAIGTQPLAIALPLGAPGCSLFVQPDVLDLLLPVGGEAAASFFVPRVASLVGLQARTQVVALELDPAGNLIRSTSTNALQLTIGGL